MIKIQNKEYLVWYAPLIAAMIHVVVFLFFVLIVGSWRDFLEVRTWFCFYGIPLIFGMLMSYLYVFFAGHFSEWYRTIIHWICFVSGSLLLLGILMGGGFLLFGILSIYWFPFFYLLIRYDTR